MTEPVLSVDGLTVRIETASGPIHPVRDVSFDIAPGETLGLVGESGCGKTMTCLAAMGLLDRGASLEAGAIRLRGETVAAARRRDAARALSRRAGMIFQNPHTCLNPVRTVGWQVAEAYRLRAGGPRAEADRQAAALLDRVGIPDAARRARDYPHQLSGGMNQRVMIAMAIAGAPDLLVADEPTTALDVTVQAQIIELMRELQQELGMAILFVTHDLGLISEIADRTAVMYAGRIVELAPAERIFERPRHPYAAGLIECLPWIDMDTDRLTPIEGRVPALDAMPAGCAFAPRCGRASERCRQETPQLIGGVACHAPVDGPRPDAAPVAKAPVHA